MREDLFRLEVEEAHAHGAIAHDAFEMAHAAATAEALLGIEGDGDVAALPDAFDIGPAAVADAVADGPDAGELVELAAGGGDAGGDGVGVVGDVDGRRDTSAARTRVSSSARRMPLIWVRLGESSTTPWRMTPGTATPMASTSPLPTTDNDFAGEDFNEFADGESVERIDLVGVLGIAHGLSNKAHIFEPAGNNVFSYYNADCGSHFALRGDLSSRDLCI